MSRQLLCVAALLCPAALSAAGFPEAQITNGAVTARFYLPDAERGYYRGTRFDWSGVTYSLQTLGHEYFGKWFEKYDPKLHDAIMGPVEEFREADTALGYDEAQPGGTFVRIGVGAVRKPDDKPFQWMKTYDIVNPGRWTVRQRRHSIEFTHVLDAGNGYAYRYTKRMRLVKNRPELVIEHRLKNTGSKPIATMQYNHNFFVIDNQPTGPASVVRFPFDLKALTPLPPDMAEVHGGTLTYKKELEQGQSVYTEFTGFGNAASDYDIHLENRKVGAGVHITGDRPIAKIIYWSIRTTFCPEAYVRINVDPGDEEKWTYRYQFYKVP